MIYLYISCSLIALELIIIFIIIKNCLKKRKNILKKIKELDKRFK